MPSESITKGMSGKGKGNNTVKLFRGNLNLGPKIIRFHLGETMPNSFIHIFVSFSPNHTSIIHKNNTMGFEIPPSF